MRMLGRIRRDENANNANELTTTIDFDVNETTTQQIVDEVLRNEPDSIENAQSPFTTVSDMQSFEKNQKIAGIMGSSLEKKIALALLWISPGIGTFLGTLPSIWFLRAIGERYLFAGSLFLSAVATSLMAFMLDDEWNQLAIAALRFVQGVAFSSAFPIMGSVSANWGTLKEQFLLLACSIFFIESTPALSWPICARFIEYDYKLPYFIHSTATFIFAFIWAVFYRNRPQYHPWVNGLELNKIVSGKVGAFNNRALEDQPFHVLLKSVPVWAIWMASFGFFIISTLLSQFLPTYFSIGHDILSSPTEWRPTVLVCAALLLICATIFGFLADVKAEKWAKQSWDPSAARRMINAEQIDYHYDECGIIEMRSLSQ
ncbi:unnamed protein product [Anisakis simplex]|uniref:Sialin (inferred by orthology to a human protein) n=1 Tax=Anisakis simplex TaxID=6269 RepID=A0A0M3JWR3_ANISI|nr:unnamed protein product [Anisakis simplex]